jgi:two-component system, OmpR family, phosphate regulon response regulator PhoB
MPANILIVEDEDSISTLLAYNFEAEGYGVRIAPDGESVAGLIAEEKPDVIVLDWMLPGISGIDICRLLKQRPETRDIPVIMLTARGEESEKLRGLATGADDYLVKPFSVPEFLARVKALLRRKSPDLVNDVLEAGDIALDRRAKRVRRGVRDVNLSPTEFRLLEQLMQAPGRVYSRSQLLDKVWGHDLDVEERTVDVHVGRLRKMLKRGRETDPIRTVRSMGYSFDERFGKGS